jgi:peptidoglycan lytic transglycosylase
MFKMRANIIAMGLIGGAVMLPLNLAHAEQVGHASWYALHSRTASGETMNPGDLTAAHRSLPFGTRVLVENLSNGHSVVVRINDRGPFVAGRIIDVSKAAASSLGMLGSGTAKVRVSSAGGASAKHSAPKLAGPMRSAPEVKVVAARANARKTVAVASRELRRAPRRGLAPGVVLASADSPYSVFGRSAPGFMKD